MIFCCFVCEMIWRNDGCVFASKLSYHELSFADLFYYVLWCIFIILWITIRNHVSCLQQLHHLVCYSNCKCHTDLIPSSFWKICLFGFWLRYHINAKDIIRFCWRIPFAVVKLLIKMLQNQILCWIFLANLGLVSKI